jgi:hypothetical protein
MRWLKNRQKKARKQKIGKLLPLSPLLITDIFLYRKTSSKQASKNAQAAVAGLPTHLKR